MKLQQFFPVLFLCSCSLIDLYGIGQVPKVLVGDGMSNSSNSIAESYPKPSIGGIKEKEPIINEHLDATLGSGQAAPALSPVSDKDKAANAAIAQPAITSFGSGGIKESEPVINEHLDAPLGSGPAAPPLSPVPTQGNVPDKEKSESCEKGIYIPACSDEKYDQTINVKITGFVKYDAFVDSRIPFAYNNGLLMLVPLPPYFDPNGVDIYNNPQWNMLALQTRVYFDITGPKIGHAKTAARVGVDFVDPLNASVARIRFAYMQFEWEYHKEERSKLLVGHYYHPVSLDEAFPDTLGYNEGTLFDPFAYAPQVTYRYTYEHFTIFGSLNSDWANWAARNAAFPSFFLGGHVKFWGECFVGAGFDFHKELPRLQTDKLIATSGKSYATSNSINSWLYYTFAAFAKNGFQLKLRYIWLENGIRYCMLGGYAARADCYDPVTNQEVYTNLRAIAYWTELIYRHKKAEFGVFFGYTKNIGSKHPIVTLPDGTADLRLIATSYPGAAITNYVVDFQPRIKFYLDPILFGLELQYTTATYGSVDRYGRVFNAKPYADARIEFAIFYNF